ncbi:uncharacterized protein LOC114451171 [Parambassis ranga]|uniref:Uncharacterized protein LOC114451171 n=1 Tax=Parambassis ranga TaxID=210632 RepID=A0A6P7KAR6_9TELE|nr:uncharacterized protein LOC114451171 [Parambassis ranga]
MTSLSFVLYLIYLFWRRAAVALDNNLSLRVHQESGVISANVGDNVTLRCFYKDSVASMFYWFKQTPGQKPKLLSTFYKHKDSTFKGEFKDNPRFSLESKNGKNHLLISHLQISDSATYYCIGCYAYKFEFGDGITVNVKGSGLNIRVHQSESESFQPGDSVTLNCTIHTGTCDGEHSVYWFRPSEESRPGLIYTHGGRNDQCETHTQTHSCMYSLPLRSLNLSYDETYYCAIASCGHIVLMDGSDGTELSLADGVKSLDFLVYVLSGIWAFTTILCVVMAVLVCKIKERNPCQCTGSQAKSPDTSTTNTEQVIYVSRTCSTVQHHFRSVWSVKSGKVCSKMGLQMLIFYLTCLLFFNMVQTAPREASSPVHHDGAFVSAKTTESLTLQCYYDGDVAPRLYWYKQSVGQKPRLISTFFIYETNGTFHGEFKNNPRFTLLNENGGNHLKITDLRHSDSGTYHCVSSYLYSLTFSESVTVSVEESSVNIQVSVHQSISESIQPGGSVTLNCTVHTGTYYCTVTSCGHIQFGNETKLDIDEVDMVSYVWRGAFVFTFFCLSVLLAFTVCMMKKRNSCHTPEPQTRSSNLHTAETKDAWPAERLYYAAVGVNLTNRSRKQRDQTWSESVYYCAKQ